jgi:GUN4-like/TIR domain
MRNFLRNYIFNKPYHKYDIFLSHASEDKSFAKPLWEKLKETYIVWYDENNMVVKDRLDKKIEEGLKNSKYGIIILSHHYLAKHKTWARWKFEKILKNGKICPILHNITIEEIQNKYPTAYQAIKNILYISSFRGRDYIISEAKKAIGEDSLCTEKAIDYIRLRDLLAAKNWREANQETYRVMIQAVGKKDGDSITSDELLNFPCTDLRTIDRLWVKYSNGHFGFSVQKEIYLSVGGKADSTYNEEAWEKFFDRVGWRVESSGSQYSNGEWEGISSIRFTFSFDTSSPCGHLPGSSLASRLVNFNTP